MVTSCEPKIFLIGETKTIWKMDNTESPIDGGMGDYLEFIGASDWGSYGHHRSSELLTEFYGRLCYRSWKPGMNPNVTKVRSGNQEYLNNILKSGHNSVTEHAMTNWIFADVSRVFTHELVRHRVGVAISQESLRYVRLDQLKAWLPTVIQEDDFGLAVFLDTFEKLEDLQKHLAEHFELDKEGTPFAKKKAVTSAMRRIAPIGLATTIGWSCNFHMLRHVIEQRTSRHAEEEIRLVFGRVAHFAKDRWPNLFQDMREEVVNGLPEMTFGRFDKEEQ